MGAIKVNSTDVAKVYVGSTEVSKIYVGSVLVWEKSGPTPPPAPTYTNKIYGHTRSASKTLTIKVNGVSHSVTSGSDKYFELDCSGTTITDLSQCLYNQANLNDVVFDIDTANCTNFSYLVASCAYATSIDCSALDTSKATNFSAMFYNCQSAVITPPANGYQCASGLWSVQFMFYNCKHMTSVDLSTIGDAYKIVNSNGWFNGCTNLETIDFTGLKDLDPSQTTNLFLNCSALTSIKVAGADATSIATLLSCLTSSGLSFTQSGDYLIPSNA